MPDTEIQGVKSAGHLASIYDYIGQDSPRYAKRMVDRVTARSKI